MHRQIVRYIEQCNERKEPVQIEIIDNIENTISYISSYDREIANLKQKIEDFEKDRLIIQNGCKHPLKEFVPDPSGNNDSYYYCRVCRKEL